MQHVLYGVADYLKHSKVVMEDFKDFKILKLDTGYINNISISSHWGNVGFFILEAAGGEEATRAGSLKH